MGIAYRVEAAATIVGVGVEIGLASVRQVIITVGKRGSAINTASTVRTEPDAVDTGAGYTTVAAVIGVVALEDFTPIQRISITIPEAALASYENTISGLALSDPIWSTAGCSTATAVVGIGESVDLTSIWEEVIAVRESQLAGELTLSRHTSTLHVGISRAWCSACSAAFNTRL
jgi:hypothetical protein